MWEDFVLWFAAVAVISVGLIVMVGLWIEHHDDQDAGPSTEDERIGSLTRRYVHGDLTLDEFEEQVDAVLRGEPLFTLDPWWANQQPVGLWITEETIVKYPQAGGTVIL